MATTSARCRMPKTLHAFGDRSFGGVVGRHQQIRDASGCARKPRSTERPAPAAACHRATSSPTNRCSSVWPTVPIAPKIPSAIGRSNPAPSLRTLAGARLMVTALVRISEAGIDQRRLDPLAALAHRRIGHADRDEVARCRARIHIHFDIDQMRVDAENGRAAGPKKRHTMFSGLPARFVAFLFS